MITVVTLIWKGRRDYRIRHAEALARTVRRFASFPFRFVVVTNEPYAGTEVEVVRMTKETRALIEVNLVREPYPSNFPKLWLFSEEARELGDEILYIDADSVVCGDLAPIVDWSPGAPFVGWSPRRPTPKVFPKLYSGMFRMKTGTRPDIWTEFRDFVGDDAARAERFGGSDQAWINKKIGDCPLWPDRELGIWLLSECYQRTGEKTYTRNLPAGARIVHPTGIGKPWDESLRSRFPWIREYVEQ